MKKLILAIPFVLLLGACTPETYAKTTGEIVNKHEGASRFGEVYEVDVAYPTSDGKYKVDSVSLDDKTTFDSYKIKEKVTVFSNENGIGTIEK